MFVTSLIWNHTINNLKMYKLWPPLILSWCWKCGAPINIEWVERQVIKVIKKTKIFFVFQFFKEIKIRIKFSCNQLACRNGVSAFQED